MLTMPADLPAPALSRNAWTVLAKRYCRRDESGAPTEDARALFWRVAASIAAVEDESRSSWKRADLAAAFYRLMADKRFLPNSPTLMNAGSELGQLSACFVLPVGDSIEEIFDAVKFAAMIHKSGGGTGFSFSRLRPRDARVGSTGGVASGPVSFLRIFNTATEQIKQGGARRGANMGILRVDHPDIIEFIRAKEQEGEFNNFNLSVGITEAFMQAVDDDADYPLIAPHTGREQGRLRAREVFDLLAEKAWLSGDPGIVFLDRINRDNPTPGQGEIESTNPCGEQPLLPYEACNLGSVNLSAFFSPTEQDGIAWESLKKTVHLAVRFLDNVIDASRFPLERIAERVRRNRKIGLGVMGWADLLYQLRIPYDSAEAVTLAERVMDCIQTTGREASARLARERGPFPAYAESIYPGLGVEPLRNATITTIAPTGTLSILAGCSSGIEPLFALSFARNIMEGERLLEVNPHFERALTEAGLYSAELAEEVSRQGSIRAVETLPAELRRVFVTAMDIAPEWHLRMQAAFQRHTDNAVSKTVNLPHSATVEDIRAIYRMACAEGCKGVTVYRDGCKATQVLTTGVAGTRPPAATRVRERPDLVTGFTQKIQTGLGAMYLTVNEVDGKPFEVFATIGKSGHSVTAKAEAIGRLVSLAFRSGIDVRDVVGQLKGIGGEHPVLQRKGLLLSIPDAIAWALENRYLKGRPRPAGTLASADASTLDGAPRAPQDPLHPPVPPDPLGPLDRGRCPDCGAELVFQEGCRACPNCAYTRCG